MKLSLGERSDCAEAPARRYPKMFSAYPVGPKAKPSQVRPAQNLLAPFSHLLRQFLCPLLPLLLYYMICDVVCGCAPVPRGCVHGFHALLAQVAPFTSFSQRTSPHSSVYDGSIAKGWSSHAGADVPAAE